MASTLIDVNRLKANPYNPRTISEAQIQRLKDSVISFPQMLKLRPIVVKKAADGTYVVLGGNMRLEACRLAGIKKVPVVLADDLTEEQQREFVIKDNLGYGEWDWDVIRNEWPEAQEWGLDVPKWEAPELEEPSGYDEQPQWFLNVRCENEQQTQQLYEQLTAKGYDCKIIT